MRGVAFGAGALVGIAVLAILLLFVFQRRLIYPAPAVAASIVAPGFDRVALYTADDLALTALYRPAAPQRPTIIFFHGNGDSLSGSLAATAGLARAGFGLLLLEYRGDGGNPGSPYEAGLYADAEAAAAFLRQKGILDRDTIAYGNSLGSGPATELATRRPLAALVIVSGFASLPDVVASKLSPLPVWRLVLDRFDNLFKLRRSSLPVLILHGSADRVIPLAQGQALGSARAGIVYREVPSLGHELAYSPQAQDLIAAWLGSQQRDR